nr:pirin family protein [Polyangium aurulentum]
MRPSTSRRSILAAMGLGSLSALVLGNAAGEEGERTDNRKNPTKEKESLMITLRRSEERGHANHGWLNSYHTFSFANYYDPRHMGFGPLRVINEDRVQPGQGFGTHPHRDMEIISYVLEGALEHKDSMGTGSVIRPGDVQRMTAGTGVTHSEFNGSRSELVHFLQIWIMPEERNLRPSYEQKRFSDEDKRGKLRLIASRDGREGSVTVHQDASIYATILGTGEEVRHALSPGRSAWVHVARGEIEIDGKVLRAGDAASVTGEGEVVLKGHGDGEALLFDLS